MSGPPILTSPEGNGGIVAQDGFDYQIHYGVIQIAKWLADPTFEGVMFEALEDIEARFFAPQTANSRLLIRIQAKSGSLDRAAVLAVLENFVRFERHFPEVAKAFELVTPQLPAKLAWVVRDLERVRFAGPFYAPFRKLMSASDSEVRHSLTDEFGNEAGRLLFERGQIVLQPAAGVTGAFALFAEAFERTYPNVPLKRATFDDLVLLARNSTKSFLTRSQIVSTLEASLKTPLELAPTAVLAMIGDRPEAPSSGSLIFDAQFLSGEGRFSSPEVWASDLIEPLRNIRAWWQSRGRRRVSVTGSYRLTAAFVVGATFNAGSGFDLDIETKDGIWRTDDHAAAETVAPNWATTAAETTIDGVLNVAVGVLRDPTEVLSASMPSHMVARAVINEPIVSAKQMQSVVSSLKIFLASEVARLQARQINLYFVGPAALAMALGHRWNAIAPVQFFEFDMTNGRYHPTARL